jgi:glycosyltransferase involved in cell wall biosynthesis
VPEKRYRLGILTTHPIQYQVPWFRRLAGLPEIDLTVFFGQIPDRTGQGDGFGVAFQWDVPLLDGYRYRVMKNVSRHPSVTRFNGCDTPEIIDTVRRGAFDAFVVNGWVVKSCLQALFACRRFAVPCLVRGEANVLRPRPWWKRVVHRLLVRQYAACLYIGKSNAEFYRRHGVPQERLFPALYCVDNERFAQHAAAEGGREVARQRWKIPEDRIVYLYCAKFIPKKHPLELLRAFHSAAERTSAIHLLMVGDGELRSQCESYASQHRLPVSFAGFLNQSELPAAYAAADCLVLPSDSGETWGLVVNEAMACGLPAIVSDQVGCGPDLVEPGQTGAVFPFGDWSALAGLLVEWAGEPETVRRQGQNARRKVAAYSIEAAAQGTLEAVRFAAGGKSGCRRL